MTEILKAAINAVGGIDRWSEISSIDLRFNFSGAMLEIKGFFGYLQPSCSINIRNCQVVFQLLAAPTRC